MNERYVLMKLQCIYNSILFKIGIMINYGISYFGPPDMFFYCNLYVVSGILLINHLELKLSHGNAYLQTDYYNDDTAIT